MLQVIIMERLNLRFLFIREESHTPVRVAAAAVVKWNTLIEHRKNSNKAFLFQASATPSGMRKKMTTRRRLEINHHLLLVQPHRGPQLAME